MRYKTPLFSFCFCVLKSSVFFHYKVQSVFTLQFLMFLTKKFNKSQLSKHRTLEGGLLFVKVALLLSGTQF